eukprot:TRINITY_DN1420_c2_g1_i1.p1 TRINITY_DN1420_c2_g1~~TRINITY_DN1420_c2_g1_i1.p1  ORF type:complete len:188 (+),score=28.91 TRINITY_DN1420_c2_g1_i1:51-566(+)
MAGACPYGDLFEHIDRGNVECLNESPERPVSNIFPTSDSGSTGNCLESDTDEELLLNIPFRQNVKVYSLEFTAPNDGRKPNGIKVFINQSNLAFEDCESLPALQDIELDWSPAGDVQKAVVLTRFVKFQSVNTIHLYVKSNTEDSPTTCLSGLTILGVANGDQFKWNPKQG